MRAHVQALPFENVDVVLGQHQGISLDVVHAKLVGRRRGGYCYEQSGLFAAVLEQPRPTVTAFTPTSGSAPGSSP